MSDQFYKYISNKLISFFVNEDIKMGDKYFIEFDEDKQVNLLYNNLRSESYKNKLTIGSFEFSYENGKPFETYYIDINDSYKIVVANSSSVTVDYLVTLRNAVTEQNGVWKYSILLIIGKDINDSIQKGMRDLQKEGMPLHFKTIYENLKNEIYDINNNISKVDREIINFDIDSKINNIYESNIWDYEDVLGLINKAHVDEEDLKKMKLFPDPGLYENLRQNTIIKRLEDNNRIYQNIESYHKYENTKEKIEKKFDPQCTKKLSNKNSWFNTPYTYIKSHDNVKNGSIEYLESDIKLTEHDNLVFWEKPLNHNKAGQRKRHIIVFNTKECKTIQLKFEFDKRLSKKYLLDKKSKEFAEISGKNIIITVNTSDRKVTFARVVYKHEDLTKLRYEFNIAVVNCNESLLEPIKSDYTVSTTSRIKVIEIINDDTSTPVIIGSGENEITEEINENGDIVNIGDKDTIKISENSAAWSVEEKLQFNLNYNSFLIPISIKEERDRAVPTPSINIWNLKRENMASFRFNGTKVTQGVNSFYIYPEFKKILNFEKQMIMNDIFYGEIDINDNINKIPLNISDTLKKKYLDILNYYKNMELEEDNCGYPSLTYIDKDLEHLYNDFLNEYNNEIESIEEKKAISGNKSKHDLNKIGVIKTNNEIYYSSLSPINMAYQLEVNNQLNNEKIDNNILNRINDENLVPFIYKGKKELFKSTIQNVAKEWIKYEKEEDVNIGSTNQFISKVIEQKIRDFINNFDYLFIDDNSAPIKLNIINIKQDKEIVKGVFNFINKRISENKSVIPVELNLYNNADKSSFDDFFACEDENDLNDKFNLKIKNKDIDKKDLLHLIQNNITYYKNTKNSFNDYEYAHISFFKSGDGTEDANHSMEKIDTGLSLNGILSDPTSFNSKSGYRVGFGSKGLLNKDSMLIRTVINTNELAVNNKNKGNDSYTKGLTIVSQPTEPDEEDIERLFEKSLWVTFIEPSFGLEYFDNRSNIIIIHYSDQYTSSNKYDTITVTDKNRQYKEIIRTFLNNKEIQFDEEKLDNVIRIFNGINGEWLLRVINYNNYSNREKLSVISAIKYTYGLLNHSQIIWVPISMEEILRIAGTVGLNKSEGLFKKSLLKGRFSDDLLFVGINISQQNIKVYFHPVEVKQGIISSNIFTTAEEQLTNTINLINTQLVENENNLFKSKFYRNFFMQLALGNIKKLKKLDFWSERKLNKIEKIKPYLLNDEYELSTELNQYIGEGSVFAFNVKREYSNIDYEDNLQIIEMPDEFAYNGLTKSIEEICDQLINKSEFKEDDLLSKKISSDNKIFKIDNTVDHDSKGIPLEPQQPEMGVTIEYPTDDNTQTQTIKPERNTNQQEKDQDKVEVKEEKPILDESISKEITKLSNIRALIGTIPHGDKKIYWEYGNRELSNRHLLILGKSGYGKTYFMQCLIKEMSKQDVPTIIIDYSDAFMTSEIHDDLKEYLGEDLIKYNVKVKKFPLNPFRKNKSLFDDEEIFETNLDVASRIKSVFSSVYNLGIQQENILVKAINSGLNKYDKEMSFGYLMEELEITDNKHAESVLGQLNEFLLFNPFTSDTNFEWSELDSRNKKVIIIQLHGFSKDIQKIITEFILWDLWNYKSLHGSSNKPFNIILDEAQNLDYSDNSPCIKILKEGRKFGWSAWFATQTVKGLIKNSDANPFNIAEQSVYFHPVENVKTVAGEFTTNNQDKAYWAEKLNELKKAECITIGPNKNLDGSLNSSKPNYVQINSLEER